MNTNAQTSRIKFTKSNPSARGERPLVSCFDCGEMTAAPLLVYRLIGPEGNEYRGTVYVHRAGAGCHKGMTATEVRES